MESKICTSIEQSKKLIELGIDISTADMYYSKHFLKNYYSPIPLIGICSVIPDQIPAWSLVALRSLLPSVLEFNGETYLFDSYNTSDRVWVYQYAALNGSILFYYKSTCEVDACYKMIVNLDEQKLL